MMGGFKKLQPIVLDGFSHDIQMQQLFDTSWGAAWLTKVYTNVDHELFRNMDPTVFRRIRYGNNVAVLFGALMECAGLYELSSFWQVISQGFSANADAVKAIVTALVDARRAVRHRYATSGSSQTARSADEWIEFLDQRRRNISIFNAEPSEEADLRALAAAFFKKQQNQWLNAAWAPLKDQPGISQPQLSTKASSSDRPASKDPSADKGGGNTIRSNPRKRSASLPPDRSSKQAKTSSTSTTNTPVPVEAQTKVPLLQSTNPAPSSPRLVSIKLPSVPGEPPAPRSSWLLKANSHIPAKPPAVAELVPLSSTSTASAEQAELAKLKARILTLEKGLVDARSTYPNAFDNNRTATKESRAITASPAASTIDPQELKNTLSTITNAVSTLMESSHHIVDGLQKLQDDIASRPPPQVSPPLQQLLTPDPPVAYHTQLDAQHQHSETKALLLAITEQIASKSRKDAPTTLEQALALAEKDLKRHYETLMKFYHEMPSTRGLVDSMTNRMAGILAGLDDGVKRIGEVRSRKF
ncbi:hypothetical protein QBC36DRAFT_390065 [Triangularia setosa]|uniref:Uncharacterized protein n=1 Tax=Triangularia setosa TaxID=2587417 RepID=A0AAN6W0D2_9PEZI|nr:hypothetical protein QBC36DRAFT_390065 [Podospora setosa]